ncbi:MAG: DUF4395 domain-containing protein [Umezawaea sp.]
MAEQHGHDPRPARGVDPRGVRFTAAMTSAVLAIGLATGSARLLLAQALLFGLCAAFGLQLNPYGVAYRKTLQSRLAPPTDLEAEGPLRFSQGVGCVFASLGALGYATGATTLGAVATALALAAALLNAVFGVCLGCHLYLLLARTRHRVFAT